MNLIIVPILILALSLIPFIIGVYKDANESMHDLNESMRRRKSKHEGLI
jgi:hypothetical protein